MKMIIVVAAAAKPKKGPPTKVVNAKTRKTRSNPSNRALANFLIKSCNYLPKYLFLPALPALETLAEPKTLVCTFALLVLFATHIATCLAAIKS